MKVYGKGIVAEFIDAFIYAFLIVLLDFHFPFLKERDIVFYLLLLYTEQIKEIVFKGVTIGRIIMKIRIYDSNWEKPSVAIMLKRWHLVTGMQTYKAHRLFVERYSKMEIIEAELNTFGTRLIEIKEFKRFSEEAKALPGRWQDNMCRLYDAYLFKLYDKKEDQ